MLETNLLKIRSNVLNGFSRSKFTLSLNIDSKKINSRLLFVFFLFVGSVLTTFDVMAQVKVDVEREFRWYELIIDTIVDGVPIDLQTKTNEFLGLFNQAENSKKAVLLVHGRGLHPNWEDVIYPLRTGLVKDGWSTLSLQMPVLPNGATYYDYVPLFDIASERIDAGIGYLYDIGVSNIVILAHSCGVHMAMHRVDTKGTAGIDAFIGISMGATDFGQTLVKPYPLQVMKIPLLDIYGENDFLAVKKFAPDRKRSTELSGSVGSKQLELPEAGHYYMEQGDQLTAAVMDWLRNL